MPVDFNITCYHCSSFLTVSDEFVGQEVQCPACEEEMLVPPLAKALKLERISTGEPRPVRPEEEQDARERYPAALDYMDGATTKNCWEFGILARVVNDQLDRLGAVSEMIPAEPGVYERPPFHLVPHADMVRFINGVADEFIGLQIALDELFGGGVQEALFQDDLRKIIDFGVKLSDIIDSVVELGKRLGGRSLPEQSPYPELYGILRGWPDHWCDVLDAAVSLLQNVYEESGTNLWHSEMQTSFTPPDFYEFFLLKNKLPRKKAF